MTRLLIHVEGETEETFVNELLSPHLLDYGLTSVAARIIGNARARKSRGGIISWQKIRNDISKHLLCDDSAYATMMVDYYALPPSWPGVSSCADLNPMQISSFLKTKMSEDFTHEYGEEISSRFIPYIVMHEFEGLLFSHPERMADGMAESDLFPRFEEIRAEFDSPEHINNSHATAPSKRITALLNNYQKPLHGNLAALEVSLNCIQQECESFRCWLNQLESIGEI